MKKGKIVDIVKNATGFTVSMGTGTIVSNLIKATTPPGTGKLVGLLIKASSFAISCAVAGLASKYVDNEIDSTIDDVESTINKINNSEEATDGREETD